MTSPGSTRIGRDRSVDRSPLRGVSVRRIPVRQVPVRQVPVQGVRVRVRSRAARRRLGILGLIGALCAGVLGGCTVTAGSAVLISGSAVSEQSVAHDTATFFAETATAAGAAPSSAAASSGALSSTAAGPSDADVAAVNRAQITYLVRHALIADAIAGQRIVVTDAQIDAATAQVTASAPDLAHQLSLPSSDQAGVIHDLVAVDDMVAKLPPTGAQVQDVSVTAEGVPAHSRDEAVALRSKYLADSAAMDAAVSAAGDQAVPRQVYSLIQRPGVGAFGLYQPTAGEVLILPSQGAYLVLRTTGRAVVPARLTAASFTALQGQANSLPNAFDLGALLLTDYQAGASISVNPRYGVWDPASLQVVPGNDGL